MRQFDKKAVSLPDYSRVSSGRIAMPIKEMPAFVFSHRHVRNAVYCALAASFALVAQLILMKNGPVALIFNIIIPFTAAITFGCHAITMAMDRPVMLLDSTLVYFVSLLLNQLVSVEIGVEETYPVFTFLEWVPFLFFAVSVVTDKGKTLSRRVLRVAGALLLAGSAVIAALAVFFNLKLFTDRNYLKYTFSMICGFFSVAAMYFGMEQLLVISGTLRGTRKRRSQRQAETPPANG